MKNALANDETARKETAASRERSGEVPDVGLASILKNQNILQNTQKETSIDIANKIIQSDSERLKIDGNNQLLSKEHTIQVKGAVAEMIETCSDNEDYKGKFLCKIRLLW